MPYINRREGGRGWRARPWRVLDAESDGAPLDAGKHCDVLRGRWRARAGLGD